MQVPILRQGPYLIATIQSALTDGDLVQLRDELADRVGRYRSRGVVIDVTALDVIDSFATRTLRAVAQIMLLRGAVTIAAGIQPNVAFAMVQLGLTLDDIPTVVDLDAALELLAGRHHQDGPRAV